MTEITVADCDDLPRLAELLASYQRFYGVARPDDERNRAFLERFCAGDAAAGVLLAARAGTSIVGFACVYWTQDSISASDIALLHDLFVDEPARRRGLGRALLDAAAAVARERGLRALSWSTAPDNLPAQRLYDTLGAERSSWLEYTLSLG